MGLELELDDEATIFSAAAINGRLSVTGEPIQAYRDTLTWGRERLYGLFGDGTPAESLVRAQAFLVDEVLRQAWSRHLGDTNGVMLAAVGGYGRGELLPYSDVDLLLLHDGKSLDVAQSGIEKFLAFLWDIGLDIGSSVRTVKDCAKQAKDDITVMTNMMEARALAGSLSLFDDLQEALAPSRLWPVKDFYQAKLEEQKQRHHKFDDSAYKLEPNVKESPGGLRDIHTIAWVAKRHFGARSLSELREKGFLTAQECNDLFAGQDFLWRVRFAIHMLTGRREDRLLFDHQVRIAAMFGYVDNDDVPNAAVEQFMRLYYRTIKSLLCLNDLLLQLFDEAIVDPAPPEPKPLNARFQIRGGFIDARSPDVFRRSPSALIEIFLLLQQHPKLKGIRAETLRLIRRDRRLVDEGLRDDVHARAMFMDMFRTPGLTRALRRMNRYGVLGRYLPAFGQIIGHMQYDLFHTLTVDEHTLYMVRNLRRMAMAMFRSELPFASEVMDRIEKRELLYLAGLFHDIAKGRGGDHSELGASDATQFCLDHGLSQADADLVAWLVKNHLLMSITAQKQDVDDPEVVRAFATRVATPERLDHLFLMTCADIRATNPALWNSWRESLLNTLYKAAGRCLDRGVQHPIKTEEVVREDKTTALALLKQANIDPKSVGTVWARFDDDYFLRHTPQEMAWHLPHLLDVKENSLPLVLVEPLAESGTTVFIYMRDRDHLFAITTGVLARLGLNILDARISTTGDGYTLDSFVIMEEAASTPSTPQRNEEICDALRKALADTETSVIDVNRRVSARLRHFKTPTSVSFRQDEARGRTIMELVTADRPGLLSIIGRVFHRRGIRLEAAKIGTMGERVEDVFFITDAHGWPIANEDTLDELRQVLKRTLHRGDFRAEDFELTTEPATV